MATWQMPEMRFGEVSVKQNVFVSMRDGTKLAADIYAPKTDEKLPVLLLRTPYDKATAQTCVYLDTMWYARYGYIVVVQDCRGRYASEGEFYPYRHETDDGIDTIKWAASLPESNGEVAMYGFSYPGSLQLLAASGKLPELKTIIPAMTSSSFYEPWTYEGGVLTQGFVQSWCLSLARDTAVRAGDVDGFKKILGTLGQYNAVCYATPLNVVLDEFRQYMPYYFDWIEHDTYDQYWKSLCVQERYDDLSLPVFHIGGWYDIFISGTIKNFIKLKKLAAKDGSRGRQKLLIGPWHHVPWQPKVGCVNFGADAENLVDLVQLKWLEQTFRPGHGAASGSKEVFPAESAFCDAKTCFENDSDVSVFVLGANKWAHFDNWPPSQSKTRALYLHSGGRANATAGDGSLSEQQSAVKEPWDSFIYDPTFPVASAGGHGCCFEDMLPMGACDQSPNQMRNDVLVYSTPALERDLIIAGAVSVLVYVSTTAEDTDFTATLSYVDSGGRAVNLCNGIAKLSRCGVPAQEYRDSTRAQSVEQIMDGFEENRFATRSQRSSIQSSVVYALEIHLGWIAAQIKEGHRLRLDVSSSNFPHYERSNNTLNRFADLTEFKSARQTLFHDDSYPSAVYLQVL